MSTANQAEQEQAENPGGVEELGEIAAKRLRCQEPDVVVVVGPDQVEFQCYRIVLSLSSDVFDAMLSNALVENEHSRIVLPDVDPTIWEMFYTFMDPRTYRSAKITKENLDVLVPLFHRYQLKELLAECDKFLASEINDEKPLYELLPPLSELLPPLSLAATFELKNSRDVATKKIKVILQWEAWPKDKL